MSYQQPRGVTFAGDKVAFGSHPAMASAQDPATLAALTGVAAPAREANAAGTNTLSCNTCREVFRSLDELRRHFDSELHRYNVRARVEGSPTMDRAEFRRANGGADPDTVGQFAPAPIFTCNLCKRTYKSAQTLQSHLKSTEHLIRKEQKILQRQSDAGSVLSSASLGSAAMGLHRRHKAHTKNLLARNGGGASVDGIPVLESVIDDDGRVVMRAVATAPKVPLEDREADVTPARCFFCGFKSAHISSNLTHMREVHQFTLPLEDDITNLAGMMDYISKKINACLCLVCAENTKRYATLEALRGHMRSAGHERLALGPEYQEFYASKMDDGSEAKLNLVEDERTGQLVVKTAAGVSIMPREPELCGAVRHQRESLVEKDERRLLTAQRVEEHQLMVRERAELEAPKWKEQNQLAGRQKLQQQQWDMKVSINANKFHPKGWDGNTLFTF